MPLASKVWILSLRVQDSSHSGTVCCCTVQRILDRPSLQVRHLGQVRNNGLQVGPNVIMEYHGEGFGNRVNE